MRLSIIIINYKVAYYLEQCLCSVMRAAAGLDVAVTVADNASGDGSMAYLQPLFPGVKFIENTGNLGFSRANNIAWRQTPGDFVLFLNPDTILAETSLHMMLDHMQTDAAIGAMGVRMVDGRGRFLPESKRSFPSPWRSFAKLSGLAAVFPSSRWFNAYALGYLNEHQTHDVEVLAGACMLVRGDLLNRLQGFDEDYFLYGEDIDLSYRIRQSGYRNVYFPAVTIIHFKGESSRKTGLERVKHFYGAMQVFVQKHYRSGPGKIYSALLSLAIGIRGTLSAVKKILSPVSLPLTDLVLVWTALQAMRMSWIKWVRQGEDFRVPFITWAIPLFAVVFVLAAALAGLYERKYKPSKTLASIVFATICVLAAYALLPESIRFSRAVVTGGILTGGMGVWLLRQCLLSTQSRLMVSEKEDKGQTIVVCAQDEYESVVKLLDATWHSQPLGRVSLNENDEVALCGIHELALLEKTFAINRIIFCAGSYSWRDMIACAENLSAQHKRFLFHNIGSGGMVGSQTLAPGATVVTPDIAYAINRPYQRRMKRVLDVQLSLALLVLLPLHYLLRPHATQLLQHCIQVLAGKKTWVGYGGNGSALPGIKAGILTPAGGRQAGSAQLIARADALYARDYDWWQDFLLVIKNYRIL